MLVDLVILFIHSFIRVSSPLAPPHAEKAAAAAITLVAQQESDRERVARDAAKRGGTLYDISKLSDFGRLQFRGECSDGPELHLRLIKLLRAPGARVKRWRLWPEPTLMADKDGKVDRRIAEESSRVVLARGAWTTQEGAAYV